MLSQWSRAGWICRVSRGVYVPVPLETEFADEGEEDPWLIASHLFSPCYLGGWSAAEMWHLTDQIFQTVVVFTTHYFRTKNRRIGSTEYLLKKVTEEGMVGLSTVWRERGSVKVSDPSKTIPDIFTYPSLGGGILHCIDIFRAYLRSEHRDLNRIAEYIGRMPNRVAFKRLGFVAEHLCSEEVDFISVYADGITRGYSLLDSRLKGGRHVSRWQLKVPLDLLEGRFA